jgi:hypothetical protein
MAKDHPVTREVEPPQNQGPQVVEETRGQNFAEQMGVSPRKVDAVSEDAEPGIYYIGRATIRNITAEEWKKAGNDAQGPLRWDETNGHVLPLDSVNEDAMEVIRNDGGFQVVEAK